MVINLSNDSKQKLVKATEVYLLWIFCEKNIKLSVTNKEGKL